MGIFCEFLTAFSACHMSIFSFPDDNLNKYQWIFTKLCMCIDIVEIWFGITNGQILSKIDRIICPPHNSGRVLLFNVFILFVTLRVKLMESAGRGTKQAGPSCSKHC